MNSSNGLAVIVWTSKEESEIGVLHVRPDEISIRMENGRTISNKTSSNSFYKLVNHPEGTENRIFLDPILFTSRPYARDFGQIVEDVFPPSTGGFYGRMKSGKNKALYVVQEIENDPRKWLIIGDAITGEILECHTINDYEVESIRLIDNGEHQQERDEILTREEGEASRREVLDILEEPSLSWESISKLLGEVTIPNLKLGNTMRDTMSQFVPESFPKPIREELMAFLAFTSKPDILIEDPVDFSFRTNSVQQFRNLVRGHLRCVLSNTDWPPYIKYLKLSERKQLQQPIRALDAQKESPWDLFRQRVYEAFPNWMGLVIDSANDLYKKRKVITRIPATGPRAKKSRKVWKERLAAVSYGFSIRGHINTKIIGLTEIIYLGAAYRWPHRHMNFITKLGDTSKNPPHIHVMTMPKNAVERVKRFLPSITEVAWSTRKVNYELYDSNLEKWVVPVDRIIKSVNGRSSMRKLANQFTRKSEVDTYRMSLEEAKVAGLVSRGIYLIDFEKEGRFNYWGLDRKKIHSILSNLFNLGVIDISYGVDISAKLVSIATIAQGKPEQITALTDSLLRYTPTSLAWINDESDMGIVLSTLTEDAAYELVTRLPDEGIQRGLTIRCMRPTSFRSFTSDLYHRLLKPDGTWDDDVSAFLSQARSKRRELSEGNA